MPYATNGGVSRADMSNDPAWIEIDDEQYARALAGMAAGKLVSIDGGFALVDPPAPEEPPAPEHDPQPVTVMSTLTFFERFTDAEYTAVRQGPIALQRGLDSLIAAQFVDVTDPRVDEYLSAMAAAGIIDAERKAELLQPEPVA